MQASGRLRIGSGSLRGRSLRVPSGVRPTEARLKEALFSIWREPLRGARFLDLFAGSGAVGLEALSCGAREVTLVEADRDVLKVLRSNCSVAPSEAWSIEKALLPHEGPRRAAEPFDLVFADPPYVFRDVVGLLAYVRERIEPEGAFAFEHAPGAEIPATIANWKRGRARRYGGTRLSFFYPEP